jgi:DNA-binding SARP family transcriptional activator
MLDTEPAPAGVDVELETGTREPELPPPADAAPAAEAQPKLQLRQEMDMAIDNSRSMFTDVDRFIALGRIHNAISLLEFQTQRDPKDRDSWVKLMAVYRQEGMETEFQRAYAQFKRQFPEEV